MCGRYVSSKSSSDLLDEFDAVDETDGTLFEPDYNVAPTTTVRAVVTRFPREQSIGIDSQAGEIADAKTAGRTGGVVAPRTAVRQLRAVHWGLVPSWAKDVSSGNRMFNARAETVPTKSAFSRAFAKRRCLIPTDGWYEWRKTTDRAGAPSKQAYYMTSPDGRSIALAGLYEFWRPRTGADAEPGDWLVSATIITVASQGELAGIHERMPLVLDPRDWDRWLDPAADGPLDLLAGWDEAGGEGLELRPVADLVNSVKNNGPELLEPVAEPAQSLESAPSLERAQSLELF
ncbi:SOS response-associated peptidase [Jatrophihabitans telluris]|uniref:Abasic site processing protein n=1 Tax=Jatrophihabitans telluris TaxID=2038343 RepID=A0ABY4R1J8_9ACTN|nr:SOS response-associated peptidase [Jatrophihabitans telluris]UQX89801.1 SOS response-associated peptidase [Jatrophihabitans telluris]